MKEKINTMLFISFLKSVFYKERRLFILLMVFLTALILTNLSRNQISPFYVWSMYASVNHPQESYNFPVIIYNEETLATEPFYRDFHKMHYQYPLYNYLSYENYGNKDWHAEKAHHWLPKNTELTKKIYPTKEDWNNFFDSYQHLLQLKTNSILYQLQIKNVSVIYDVQGYPQVIKENIIYEKS